MALFITYGPWRSRREMTDFQAKLAILYDRRELENSQERAARAVWDAHRYGRCCFAEYWSEYAAGIPLGSGEENRKPWLDPDARRLMISYLARIEARATGDAVQAAAIASQKVRFNAPAIWDAYGNRVLRAAEQVQRDLRLGVRSPHVPVELRPPEPMLSKRQFIERGGVIAPTRSLADGEQPNAITEGDREESSDRAVPANAVCPAPPRRKGPSKVRLTHTLMWIAPTAEAVSKFWRALERLDAGDREAVLAFHVERGSRWAEVCRQGGSGWRSM